MRNRWSVYFVSILLSCISADAGALPAQAPPSKAFRAIGDQRNWVLLEPMVYVIGKTNTAIIVPAGFVTDFASIPQAAWSFGLTPTGQYGRAAVVHDYLYWTQKCSRDQADRLLLIAMKESAVGKIDETIIYEGVHKAGKSAWKKDAEDKASGFLRILPPDRRDPPDPNMNWSTYEKQLIAAGVRNAPTSDDDAYCHYGNSTDVP